MIPRDIVRDGVAALLGLSLLRLPRDPPEPTPWAWRKPASQIILTHEATPEGRCVWVEGGKTRVVQIPLVTDLEPAAAA